MGTQKRGAPGISPTAFARKIGVAPSTISRAISEGRIRNSIVKYGPRWRVVDEALAEKELEENTRALAGKLGKPNVVVVPTSASPKDSEPSRSKAEKSASADYNRERAKKVKADRELAELKLAQLRGELVPVDEAAKVFAEALSDLRAHLLAVPDRLSGDLASETDRGKVRNILRADLVSALDRASRALQTEEASEDP